MCLWTYRFTPHRWDFGGCTCSAVPTTPTHIHAARGHVPPRCSLTQLCTSGRGCALIHAYLDLLYIMCINVCFHFFQGYRTVAPTDLISEALTVSTPQASASWILLATTSPATKQERGSSGDLPASYRDLLLASACTQLPAELSCFWGCQLGTGTRPQHSCAATSC